MATKNFDEIAQSIINNILTVNPKIDIKIGEAVRDLFIDVQSSQLQDLYSLTNYSAAGASVLTARGPQLDRLAYNFNIKRIPAKRSVGFITLIIKQGLTAPTLLNVGDQVYTNVAQTGQAYTFMIAQATLLVPGTTQATVPVIALNPGKASNVAANSITVHNYDFVSNMYNSEPTINGTDDESDAAFALRIPTFVTGAYLNVYNGIQKILSGINNVSPFTQIVTSNQPLSRGPYTVDVYLQRTPDYFGTVVSETVSANVASYTFQKQPLYELNPINQITVYDATTGFTTVIPQTLGGVQQYKIANNPYDTLGTTKGSTRAGQQLVWLVPPPNLPYVVNYNVDGSIVDSQSAYDVFNELTADVLFRQARAIPIWVSANIIAKSNATIATVTNNANQNTASVFGQLNVQNSLTPNNLIFGFLSDSNVVDATVTNLDTSFDVTLTATGSPGAYIFKVTGPDENFLLHHDFTPLDVVYDNAPSQSAFQPFTVAGRLFITNPTRIIGGIVDISTTNPHVTGTGVISPDLIQNIVPNWNPSGDSTRTDTYYDAKSQTLVVSFDTAPTTALTEGNVAPQITFKMVQPKIKSVGEFSYLTLAPSLVQPLVVFPGQSTTVNPTYATVLPSGLDPALAQVYKNGLAQILSTDGVLGDYTLQYDSTTGIYRITFLTPPISTDILQFGLLNPNLTVNLSG